MLKRTNLKNQTLIYLFLFASGSNFISFSVALFFVYLSYKLRIFHCICQTLCKASRACFAICFHIWRNICHFLCHKFLSPRRKRHRRLKSKHAARDIADAESSRTDDSRCQESIKESSCHSSVGSQIDASRRSMTSHRWREHQRSHLRRSLKPRNHRVQVEISSLGRKHCRHKRRDHLVSNVHHVRVTHTSKFANKRKNRSDNNKNAVHRAEGL